MSDYNPPPVLAFEDRFSLSEKKLEKPFSDNQIDDLNQSAAGILTAIISLEQMSYDHVESEAKGVSAEIHRVEQKIDFITELLVNVLRAQQSLPIKKAITMSAKHVVWCPEIPLNTGDHCLLSIYLSQKYPSPLELPVEVLSSLSEGSTEATVEARVLLTDENVIDDLTRMVFLYHRRQIARNRTQS